MWSNAVVLHLVRHGRTAANARGLLLGRLDPPLDEVGRWQASRLAGALGPIDRVIASPLLRARETAGFLGPDVEIDDRWIELDYGELDGLPLTAIDRDTWARWVSDVDFAPPDGESMRTLADRAGLALAELGPASADAEIAVVSHVLPIKAAVAWALGVGMEVTWHLHLDQASITRIGRGLTGMVLRTYNEVAHLSGGPPR